MQDKLKKIKLPRNYSIIPVLIYAGEVEIDVLDAEYFLKIIHIKDLLGVG